MKNLVSLSVVLLMSACGGEAERVSSPTSSVPPPGELARAELPEPPLNVTLPGERGWLPRLMPAGDGLVIDRTTGLTWYTRGFYGYDSPVSPRDVVRDCAELGVSMGGSPMRPARLDEVRALILDPSAEPWVLPSVFTTSPSTPHRLEEPGCLDLLTGSMTESCGSLVGLFCVR